jgi:hypothetical protein
MKEEPQALPPQPTRFPSRRTLFIAGGALFGAVLLANIFVLVTYLTRTSQSPVAKPATPPSQPSASVAKKAATVSRVPLGAGETVQREELSASGNIRLKYVRRKGNPLRQIVLEGVNQPGQPKVLLEYQRNAWVLISPNDEWIALNNRPGVGQSEVQLYHHDGPGPLDYSISEDKREPDDQIDHVVWNYYLQELGLPPETARDGVAIDAVGWDADSKKLTVTVTVSQASTDDTVPPPWSCVVDLASKQIDVPTEAATAFNGQQGQGQGPAAAVQQLGATLPTAQTSASPLEGDFTGERYQETRTRVLTADEVSHWSLTNVRYAIDEIYARRGADFDDQPDVKKRFSKFAWYKPRPGLSTEQIKNELPDVEKQNLAVLEKSRGSRQASGSGSRSKSSGPPKIGEKIKRFFQGGK